MQACILATGVADGDFAVHGDQRSLARRRRDVLDRPWIWLEQVHGADVVVLGDDAPVEAACGRSADAVVTRRTDVALAIQTADCAPVALVSADGVIGAAHAGWRGLLAGILPSTVEAMRTMGANGIRAVVGPCIGVECYEFGEADRRPLVEAFGSAVAGHTSDGRPALDMRSAVLASLASLGVEITFVDPRCTACGLSFAGPVPREDVSALFSHRARNDTGRQTLLVWLEAEGGTTR